MPQELGTGTRVLLGNLEPVMRLGMSRLLSDQGVEVIADGGDQQGGVVERATRLHPDAIVLDLDGAGAGELRAQTQAAAPRAKVILCARDETEMEVFDPGSSAPRRICGEVLDALLRELGNG